MSVSGFYMYSWGMYQTIGEQISVIGVYAHQAFVPRKFLWQKKEYLIDKITFVTDIRDGATRKRCYAATSGANSYRLLFNRNEETWILDQLWVE